MLAATVAALGAAAAYSAVASSGPTVTPMPSPEPITDNPTPPTEPPVETPTPPTETAVETPPPEGATAPSLPLEEPDKVADMAGGGIGRPPWGIISASSPADAPPAGITSALTSILGIQYNPKELEQQLILIERQYQQATLDIFVIEQRLERKKKEYQARLQSYATILSQKEKAVADSNFYKKKLEVKDLTRERRKQLNEIISNKDKSETDKQAARDELAAGNSGQQESATALDEYREKYAKSVGNKVKAEDEVSYAEQEKAVYKAEYDSLLKKRVELKQTLREIGEKRREVLLKLQAQVLKEPKLSLLPDWQLRLQTYAQAIKARKAAEDNLRIFLTETWNPLEGVDPNREQKFGVPKQQLTQAWKDAKVREERARIALTTVKAPDQTVGSVLSDFNAFASDIEQLTTQAGAVNDDGSAKDDIAGAAAVNEWRWGGDVDPPARDDDIRRIQGYPKAVKDLKDAVKNSQLQGAAEFYYKVSKLSPRDVSDNLPTLLDRLQKLAGSIKTGGPERTLKFIRPPFSELTKDLTKNFSYRLLEPAANSVRAFPGRFPGYDLNNPKQKLYSALRDKTNAFVDKQLYSIKKVKSLIAQALSEVGQGSKKGKDLLELQGKFEELFPLPAQVPPQGKCELTLKDETFKMFKSGKYKDKDILTEVLGGSDDELKEAFLSDIGFASITNFREAQIHAAEIIPPNPDRILFIKKAALEEYVKQAEQLARQNPSGFTSYAGVAGSANSDLMRIDSVNNTLTNLIAQPLSVLMPMPPDGALRNQARAQGLRAELTRLRTPFISGVYLKGYKLTPAGVRLGIETLIPIDGVRKACELDGNVGQGTEQTSRILSIVAALKGLTEPTKEERNPLTDFVEFLKTKRIIDDRGGLQDKSRPFTTLATRGFNRPPPPGAPPPGAPLPGIDLWRLMEVSKKDKKANAVQTFLTLHSGYFRSVGYDESAIYKGKREADIRKKYTELATDLLKKEYGIEADDKDFWKKIADEFDMNFTFYKLVDGRGVADQSLDTRPGVNMYNIYETSDGFYYPIAMTNEPFDRAQPVATGNPALGLRLRQQPFGGAIDGVKMEVEPSVEKEKADKSAAAAATREAYLKPVSDKWASAKTGVTTAANRVVTAASSGWEATKTGSVTAASAVGTAASNAFFGTPEQQLEAVKLEGQKAFESIPVADRLPVGLSAANKELIEEKRVMAVNANTALTNSVELADANTHKDTITRERDAIQQILSNHRKTAQVRAPAAAAPAPAAAVAAAAVPAAAAQAPAPAPAPSAYVSLRDLARQSAVGRGRRRTNNAWLRSKPVRYTRRKFYK